jgi:Derlin-2/3
MDWLLSLPPVTKFYFCGCITVTALVHFDVVSPLYLYLNFNRIYSHGEIWRLLSNFLFFDYFSLNWVFQMIFLIPNASQLERHHYRGKTASFLWMIVLMIVTHLVMAWLLFYYNIHRILFLGPAFSFGIVYVWSRKSQHVQMNFLGLFPFQAPYLPLVILG